MNVRIAIRRMLVFRRRHTGDPMWFRVISAPLGGPLLRRVSRLWLWIGAATVFGIGVGFVPLFGVLGYELAVAAALFAAIMGVDVGARLARELQTMPVPELARSGWPGRAMARSTAAAALLAAAIMLIPAVISAVRGLWLPTCDWWFGLHTYAAMPLATAALAGAAGHAIGVLVGPRRALAPLLAQGLLVAIAFAALWRFYAAPAVFSYNAILGYFPGNLYDEHLELTSALAWSRLEQLLWVGAFAALVACRLDVPTYRVRRGRRPAGSRRRALAIALACAACACALRWHGGALGYAVDAEDVELALGGRVETPHFIIHYARTPEIEANIDLIAADHEFRYAQVISQLEIVPEGKIRSFYFADPEQKARLMGARDVEMAKPWRREIYIDHRGYPIESLRHEIAHAVAAEFGDPIFGVAARRVFGIPVLISPGLVEGFAVAIDWPGSYDRPSPHEAVRAMQELGALPSIDQLLGLSFLTVSSARGYTTAGSFLRFLLERYGPARLRAVYHSGGDFESAYGVSRKELEAEWRAMIAQIVLPPPAVEASRERFRGGSVFDRPCPHAIAARRRRAAAAVADGDHAAAIAIWRDICRDAPDEPAYRRVLGDRLAASDDPIDRAQGLLLWLGLATDAARVTSSLRASAYERLIREFGRGEEPRALALVRSFAAAAQALPLDPNERRTIDGMAFALAHRGPAAASLRAYFFDPGPAAPADTSTPLEHALAAAIAEPALGMPHYLVGLQHFFRSEWTAAAESLERALARPLPGAAFVRNAARRLAIAAYHTRDRARLGVAISALSTLASGDRALAKDWLDRISFDDTGRLTQ